MNNLPRQMKKAESGCLDRRALNSPLIETVKASTADGRP